MRTVLRFLSRISNRLLAFNLLLVFLPAFGILSLETYELELRQQQERSMVQQGRLLAASLGERGRLEAADCERILINMEQRFEARLRVVDRDLQLLADSSRLGPRRKSTPDAEKAEAEGRQSRIYRLGSLLYRAYTLLLPPEPPLQESDLYATAERLDGEEIRDALEGRYGATTRLSPATRSVTLYSAIPIRSGGEVVGVALVSKSTFQILRALYEFRLSTFKVILGSVAAAVILTLLVSTTIARPLKRLRKESKALLDRRGRLTGSFKGSRRLDEIGDLSRALAELTRRLEGHIAFIESFASDVSHEFKNPLAAIRNATELLAEIDQPAERERFIKMVLRDVARLEHLLSGVREITRLDAELEEQPLEHIDLERLLRGLIERYEMQPRDGGYRLDLPADKAVVEADPERLVRVFENLLDNASSFSPPDEEIRVALVIRARKAVVSIRDRGPGIPDEHLEKIFSRFFSYRQNGTGGDGHTGLGLAIVKTIIESYGGEVRAANHLEGGAVFETTLPLSQR